MCSFTPSPPVSLRPKPAYGLPFSLGLSFELTQHQSEPLLPLNPPRPHRPSYHHDPPPHHRDPPHYHPPHHYKPGSCPQPDRDYYNRPGYSQSVYDTIPNGNIKIFIYKS